MLFQFEGLTKTFGSTKAVDRLDLEVGEREFVSILGPSGCGKTTLLRMLAGLEQPDSGEILIGGETVDRARVQPSESLDGVARRDGRGRPSP